MMFRFFIRFLRRRLSFALDLFEFLQEQPARRFWSSNKKGSMVSVSISSVDSEQLALLFQRPIELSDVREGKLVPSAWSGVKRRGGKRQTCVTLSLESAEMLRMILSEAIKDAKIKQRRKLFKERILNLVSSYMEMCRMAAVSK